MVHSSPIPACIPQCLLSRTIARSSLPLWGYARFSSSPVAMMCSRPPELAVDSPGLDIPDANSTVVPSPNTHTPVSRFRFYVLQPLSSSFTFPTAPASLSTAPPSGTYNLCDLSKALIPPASYLQSLKKHILNLSTEALEWYVTRIDLETTPGNWYTSNGNLYEDWEEGHSWVQSVTNISAVLPRFPRPVLSDT